MAGLLIVQVAVGVVWLCTKTGEQRICGNILLVASTLFAALSMVSVPMLGYLKDSGEFASLKTSALRPARETRADRLANELDTARMLTKLSKTKPGARGLEFFHLANEGESRERLAKFFDTKKTRTDGLQWRKDIFQADTTGGALPPAMLTNMPAIEDELGHTWFRYSFLKKVYSQRHDVKSLETLEKTEDDVALFRLKKYVVTCCEMIVTSIIGLIYFLFFLKICKSGQLFLPQQASDDPVNRCTYRQLYSMLVTSVCLQMLLGIAVGIADALMRPVLQITNLELLNVCLVMTGNLLLLPLIAWWMISRPLGVPLQSIIFPQPVKKFASTINWCLGTYCVLRVLYIVVYSFLKSLPQQESDIGNLIWTTASKNDFGQMALLAVFVVLVGPFIEEVIFRRLLYVVLRSRLGIWKSVAISAALFSAYHLNVTVLISHFIIGAALAITYERTRNLGACVLIHGLWNTYAMVMPWLMS